MARFIERCSSCEQPIYLEDDVPGACECLEGNLLQLLARKRGRTSSVGMSRIASLQPNANRDALPELTPEMFLSQGALREVQAAQATARRPHLMVDPKRTTTARIQPQEIDLDSSMDDAITASIGEGPSPTGRDDSRLASIWQRGVAADLGNDFQIEFSTTDAIELPVPPPVHGPLGDPRGSRFRVDRPPPEPAPFRRNVTGGPTRDIGEARGHRILSDRTGITHRDLPGDHRYPPIREVLDHEMTQPARIEQTSRRIQPVPSHVANARTEAQRLAEHMKLPTAFEVLRGPDPFDNDD